MTPYQSRLNEIPPLRIEGDGPDYTITGWDDLDRWACHNLTIWARATQDAKYIKATEEERLRIMAYNYARAFSQLTQEYADYKERNPPCISRL